MYFKQLELVGFKSFPYKTKLKFEPGATAVVGPNGCGKSNIADAIRWVLGEQAPKSLRGFSMEDVIFSGTDSVEPINMTEVSLTLSNETRSLPIDYNEVTITRRLFRSGESEYILNKTPVRLKDITSLLMGTGIGTNSYSIIEQGKIDLILSSKPEERRYVFEEASGITKYKSKKREALRKLEYTENNLIRINDIINEVKRQINSIERHAKKAERYKSDFEIMKEMDLKLAVYEKNCINSEVEKNSKQLETQYEEEARLKSELDEMTALVNKYRQDLDGTIQDLTEMQQKLSTATLFVDTSQHRVEINKERIEDLIKLKTHSEEELIGLRRKLRLQEEEIAKIKERFNNILRSKEDKEKMLNQKDESVRNLSREIETHQKNIKNAKNRTVDLLALQTKAKNELIKIGADLQNRRSRLRRLEAERENTQDEKKNIESQLEQVNNELNVCGEKVQGRQQAINELKNNLHSSERKLEDVKRRIAEDKSALNSLKSKEEILREMIENLEGFDRGVRLIMENVKNGNLRGIIGVVADVIDSEDGYESALELALGGKAQAVIVENRDVLKEVLHFLKENRTSARFIVHQEVRNIADRNRRRKAIMQKERISSLASFVRVDPYYKTVADYLLDSI